MLGVGPFITIPLLMGALLGPRSMLGWLVALVITLSDALVWSELGAAMPRSGGTYGYLREAFGPAKWGRLMAFLFIWQFILSGPLEIASGYIGFAQYLGYLWPQPTPFAKQMVMIGVGVGTILLLYRKIASIAKITVSLWIGALVTVAGVLAVGAANFDPKLAFDFGTESFEFSAGFLIGLGAATRVGIYDFLGYYDICYIGDEVRQPEKVIPRSILISLVLVALIYVGINLSIIGVIPWQDFVPASEKPISGYVVSILVERTLGRGAAVVFTLLVLWTAFASVFALMLGYSRIPYAAARDGMFFSVFGRLHPTKEFPHISLLLIGGLAIVCTFFPLDTVIAALIVMRILVQFIGQTFAVVALRRLWPESRRPFRMWLYPLPCVIAIAGWLFVFATSGTQIILYGLGFLAAGVVAFLIWSWRLRAWPMER